LKEFSTTTHVAPSTHALLTMSVCLHSVTNEEHFTFRANYLLDCVCATVMNVRFWKTLVRLWVTDVPRHIAQHVGREVAFCSAVRHTVENAREGSLPTAR